MAYIAANDDNLKSNRRPWRRPYRRGELRVAVLRAVAASRGYDLGNYPTLAAAMRDWRVPRSYVRAALAVVQADDPHTYWAVLLGDIPLLQAAEQLRLRVHV